MSCEPCGVPKRVSGGHSEVGVALRKAAPEPRGWRLRQFKCSRGARCLSGPGCLWPPLAMGCGSFGVPAVSFSPRCRRRESFEGYGEWHLQLLLAAQSCEAW